MVRLSYGCRARRKKERKKKIQATLSWKCWKSFSEQASGQRLYHDDRSGEKNWEGALNVDEKRDRFWYGLAVSFFLPNHERGGQQVSVEGK